MATQVFFSHEVLFKGNFTDESTPLICKYESMLTAVIKPLGMSTNGCGSCPITHL